MSHQLALPGLDGANPLGFLAALGALRTAADSLALGEVQLSWCASGAWVPLLTTESPCDEDALVEVLGRALQTDDTEAPFALGEDLKASPDVFRAYAVSAARGSSAGRRRTVDFVAAFGCDGIAKEGMIADCELRTMSGAGHQHFLGFMKQLVHITTREHLRSALFSPWVYGDDGPSLRWDPADDRRYALRWKEPSGDKIRTVRGANRLAVEGLSLVPSTPTSEGLRTTGFSGRGATHTFWSWPIWVAPLTLDAVRSVLAHPLLLAPATDTDRLTKIGVAQVFRSQRLTIGKYRNFAPARPV